MTGSKMKWMADELEQLKQRSLHRTLHETEWLGGGMLERAGRPMLNLASNDYLGLCEEPLIQLDKEVRSGAGASRLIAGSAPSHLQFEQRFAEHLGEEACLLFGSGYMANVGVLSALLNRDSVVFSDRLNHASIVDGIILSRAEVKRYRHRDLDQLETWLKKTDSKQRKLIVTDSVFSMDGTIAPLRELCELKDRYGAILMVDEAHSGGVYGDAGQGLIHKMGLTGQVDIHMGTFSKAYGCYGAYVAGDQLLIEYLVNHARSFIYTTALPPMLVHALMSRTEQVQEQHWRREQLAKNAAYFRKALQEAGCDTGDSESHIVPWIVGSNEAAVAISHALQAEGIAAVAVRPPTVPEGSARIRFSLSAVHTQDQLSDAVERILQSHRIWCKEGKG